MRRSARFALAGRAEAGERRPARLAAAPLSPQAPHLGGYRPTARNWGQSLGVTQGPAMVQSSFLSRAPVTPLGRKLVPGQAELTSDSVGCNLSTP